MNTGYLEDRRPNFAGDPYKIASRILQTNRHRADKVTGSVVEN